MDIKKVKEFLENIANGDYDTMAWSLIRCEARELILEVDVPYQLDKLEAQLESLEDRVQKLEESLKFREDVMKVARQLQEDLRRMGVVNTT